MNKVPRATTNLDTIKACAEELFTLLGLPQHELVAEAKDEAAVDLILKTDPDVSGMLIGYHGETIASLQLLISLICHRRLGAWHRLTLNVNDYRERREQNLREMALSAAERAKATGKEVIMPPMESFDRRIVHMALADDSSVVTESVGEGRDRRLIISPASS